MEKWLLNKCFPILHCSSTPIFITMFYLFPLDPLCLSIIGLFPHPLAEERYQVKDVVTVCEEFDMVNSCGLKEIV